MNEGRYKWSVAAILRFLCFFNYAGRQAIFAVFPKLQEEFGFDKVGYISDRYRRKDLIFGGCLFWSFVTIATG